jgi:hypothetical protein
VSRGRKEEPAPAAAAAPVPAPGGVMVVMFVWWVFFWSLELENVEA